MIDFLKENLKYFRDSRSVELAQDSLIYFWNNLIPISIIFIPLSTILSIVCFVSLLYFFTYFIAEGKDRAEWIMWLPVARLFLIIYGFPTALSVSFAVIKTYKKIGISQSNTD